MIFLRADGYSEAVAKAVKRLAVNEELIGDHVKPGEWENFIYNELKKDFASATCETSYKDKKGKYQSQVGLTYPTVDKGV